MEQEIRIHGVAASAGIVTGRAYVFESESFVVTKRRLAPSETGREIKRFRRAIAATHRDLNRTEADILKTLGKQHARLIDAHRLILEDPILKIDVARLIEDEKVNAEYALSEILSRINLAFEAMADEFFRERRHDLFDVGRRLLQHLTRRRNNLAQRKTILRSAIVVARNLLPSDTLHLKEKRISAFATELGGRTSHVAILSQSLGIPSVVGAADLLRQVATGDEIIVDGNEGVVIVRPTVATLRHYKQRQKQLKHEETDLLALAQAPAHTADGQRVVLSANLDTLEELATTRKFGAEGIGLFRTEFVCLGSGSKNLLYDLKAQTEIYSRVLQETAPHEAIIRLLDIGADKLVSMNLVEHAPARDARPSIFTEELREGGAAALELSMGLRGIRLALRYPKILKTQIAAILKASPAGRPRILLPMVSAIEEVREVKWLIEEVKEELGREGDVFKDNIPIGIMVEVPSVAIKIEAFLGEVDFISVGTNDLVQYTLACDRSNADLAYLYQEFHPSILQLLQNVVASAKRVGKWSSICGELAGNPLALPLLLGMGYDGLSVNPHAIPRLKKHLMTLNMSQARAITENALRLTSYEEVVEYLKKEYPAPLISA